MSTLESYLEAGKEFRSLSVRDLVEARDAYHVFLVRKKYVIGTAIGKVRFRREGVTAHAAKTLENTEVRSYSWPCVLVFVREWVPRSDFGDKGRESNDDYLPTRLYLHDGREVPVCVIKAAWRAPASKPLSRVKLPGGVIGGGYPVWTKVQGGERVATLGCLVSDGRLTFALTNLHVTGRPGEQLYTCKSGNDEPIGVSSSKRLEKMTFSKVYDGFPGRHTLVNLDIGLIELSDLDQATSQVFGLGELRGMADVNHDTLSLRLIGCPVQGYGCASGLIRGEIAGLFYRYAAIGGYEYVSDYLIGPRNGDAREDGAGLAFAAGHGDSGTVFVVDDPGSNEHMKAIAVLWGGQSDLAGGGEQPYALASNLGTVCRQLGVELVCQWNTSYDRWFGAFAHVVLPSLCADAVSDGRLRDLMEKNAERFSMPFDTPVRDTKGLSKNRFVPLSDVPDLVWKLRTGDYKRSREDANHFADMDQPNPAFGGKTLLDLCKDPSNIDPQVWVTFYEKLKAKQKGALPFRIAQVYDAMVAAAEEGSKARFVCAAGILCHYVFDACLPMHISYLHHGDPDGEMNDKGKPIAYGVHAEFDNEMVEYHAEAIGENLPSLVKRKLKQNQPVALAAIKTPRDAAVAAVKLMADAVTCSSPKKIIARYEQLLEEPKRTRSNKLWKEFGDGLQESIAEAVVLTARLWEAAWQNGHGERTIKSTSAVAESALIELYETEEGFLDSVSLKDIAGTMRWKATRARARAEA